MKVLCVDFGSTYTKLVEVDLELRAVTGAALAHTTIHSHVLDGFYAALRQLPQGDISRYDEIRAASSAAGGLKMIAVGLVPSLTANAAKLAANSAGAKLIKTYSYELSPQEASEIQAAAPDIVLLSGGIDGGNKAVITKNAAVLAGIKADFAVVLAGNKSVASQCADTLRAAGKPVDVVENVMPSFGVLNIQPAKSAIRDIFIKRIVSAKGLDDALAIVSGDIIPTPLAVFNATELLGTLCPLVAIDVGGATTDVYSMADGSPTRQFAVQKGLVEPFAKRSVEGDLGVRYSIPSLLEEVGQEHIARLSGLPEADVSAWLEACQEDQSLLPSPSQQPIDDALAAACTHLAMLRHTGTLESIYTHSGEVFVQNGKDLSEIGLLLGTGGSIINSSRAEWILSHALDIPQDPGNGILGAPPGLPQKSRVTSEKELYALRPKAPRIVVDRQNILTTMGLLARTHPDIAIDIMKKNLSI